MLPTEKLPTFNNFLQLIMSVKYKLYLKSYRNYFSQVMHEIIYWKILLVPDITKQSKPWDCSITPRLDIILLFHTGYESPRFFFILGDS